MRRTLVAFHLSVPLIPVVLVLAGCGPEQDATGRGGAGASSPTGRGQPAEVKIEAVKFDQLQDAIKAQRGKIVNPDNQFTYADVHKFVGQLLAKP